MNMKMLLEAVGWYGAAAIIIAYLLNSFSIIAANTFVYQLLNLTGAIGIIVISLIKKTYQPAAVNIIWAIVAAITLTRMALQ